MSAPTVPMPADTQTPAFWEWARTTPAEAGGMPSRGVLVQARLEHIADSAITLLEWLGFPEDGAGATLLDVSAGSSATGRLIKQHRPALTYHVTEQSDRLTMIAKNWGEASAGAVWRCAPAGPTLRGALSAAADHFFEAYDVVLASNVIDCLPEPYRFLDSCWELVRPRGFLLVAVQRNLTHRVHPLPWDWDRLMGTLAQYASPVIGFDDAQGGELVAAIPKSVPAAEGDPAA